MLASDGGHISACEILIANGANVNLADKDGLTAVDFSIRNGKTDACRLLVRNGAHVRNTFNFCAAMSAMLLEIRRAMADSRSNRLIKRVVLPLFCHVSEPTNRDKIDVFIDL